MKRNSSEPAHQSTSASAGGFHCGNSEINTDIYIYPVHKCKQKINLFTDLQYTFVNINIYKLFSELNRTAFCIVKKKTHLSYVSFICALNKHVNDVYIEICIFFIQKTCCSVQQLENL